MVAATAALMGAPTADAAKQCGEPGVEWQRATPPEAGMDAAKLQEALDYGTTNLGFAVRVFRNGCLVGEDRGAEANRNTRFESWSMAKSVTSLAFGSAMTKKLISPDDPVGSLIPEADKAHGQITLLDLLTQSSGLLWNGFRDYNVFTNNRDRLRDALTLPVVHPPGTYWEYAQSPVALAAEATARSTGEDLVAFMQRELMNPLGIEAGTWDWTRDTEGQRPLGYMGVQMTPDDYGRLGELLRRDGVWKGKRLLSHEYVERSTSAAKTSGCYGWLIWTNDGAPCVGVRITERAVHDEREYPDLPGDMYNFSGLFGQLVTVFPTQGIVVVRNGQDRGLVPAGGSDWEHELYLRVLASVTDQKVVPGGEAPKQTVDRSNPDDGFQHAWQRSDEYDSGAEPDPLPPAGPARARAAILELVRERATKRGVIAVTITCPPKWPKALPGGCVGALKLEGSKRAIKYKIGPGDRRTVRTVLKRNVLKRLRRAGLLQLDLVARNRDASDGTVTKSRVAVRSPQ